MAFIRIILFPVSVLYGFVTYVRNKLFDWKMLHSVSFQLPIISIGNLNTGGTGKTPHVEYLIRVLKTNYKIAILSRGYKRRSKGFILADQNSSHEKLGDEPYQMKIKFNDIDVAVDKKRVHGVDRLDNQIKGLDVVLLDDAFQHRWIKPGLSVLLTDFYDLYCNDNMLPSGTLREYRSGVKRADIIVVTKSPKVLSPITRKRVTDLITPGNHQSLYFSYIKHGRLSPIPGVDYIPKKTLKFSSILLVAGIANPYPLKIYLTDRCRTLEKIYFPDHHKFTTNDIARIKRTFDRILTRDKVIVTTEKDMIRFMQPNLIAMIKHLPICYLPMEIKIHKEDRKAFEQQMLNYVKNHRRNHSVH